MTPSTPTSLAGSGVCELLLQQGPGCAWLLNRGGEIHAAYGDTRRVFGRAAGDLRGLSFTSLFAPSARAAWTGRLERAFSGEMQRAVARLAEAADSFSVTLFPVRAPGGAIVFAGGFTQEVAERGLLLRLWKAQEAERARLSQLLHDRVGQSLSAAGLQLDLLRMDLADSGSPSARRAAEIQNILETVMESVRDFSYECNPAVVERIGLRAALERLAAWLRPDFIGAVRVQADLATEPPAEAGAALYRIAREAVANAARHSGCSAIEILLQSFGSGPGLEVRDNGKGFDVTDAAFRERGAGLVVMEHCAARAGLDLRIASSPGNGTVVQARCPTVEKVSAG